LVQTGLVCDAVRGLFLAEREGTPIRRTYRSEASLTGARTGGVVPSIHGR
jgi:hypothetical protein